MSIQNKNAMFNLSYGLFVLSTADAGKDNGCIVNTIMQITDTPNRIAVGVNKNNLTHDMIMNSGKLNVSILTEKAQFQVFKDFGFVSGRDVNKFAGRTDVERSANGLYYLKSANAFISATVENAVDCGTHTMFIALVDESLVLSEEESLTYSYYHKHVKPAPAAPAPTGKKQWVCDICGYVYEGDEIPEGYTCPLCGHGADAFSELVPKEKELKKWQCYCCGYVYEGEELPEDIVCPLCGQGVEAFQPKDEQPAVEQAADKKQWVCNCCGYVHEADELADDFTCPMCSVGKDFFSEKK